MVVVLVLLGGLGCWIVGGWMCWGLLCFGGCWSLGGVLLVCWWFVLWVVGVCGFGVLFVCVLLVFRLVLVDLGFVGAGVGGFVLIGCWVWEVGWGFVLCGVVVGWWGWGGVGGCFCVVFGYLGRGWLFGFGVFCWCCRSGEWCELVLGRVWFGGLFLCLF